MARLSRVAQLPAILDAAAQWKRECLLKDGSVFSNADLWTTSNLAAIDENFIQKPLLGDERFLVKLRRQLDPTPGSVKQLTAELLWLLLLFPKKITGSKKRQIVMDIWSWSGMQLDPSHPLLTLLDTGIGSTGAGYNNFRDRELRFAIRVSQQWKLRPQTGKSTFVDDPWAFGNWLSSIPEAQNRQFRHILLFLPFPDSYEDIASGRQKKEIAIKLEMLPGMAGKALTVENADSPEVALDKTIRSFCPSGGCWNSGGKRCI